MPNRKLNKRQLAYCYWRARDYTIEEALRKSGYICKGGNARSVGSHMEQEDNIKQRIEEERLNIFDKSKITEEYILEGLRKIAEEGKQEANKVAAFQLLGKYLAMFTDKIDSRQHIEIKPEEQLEIKDLRQRYSLC